jgi:hypothetical protein
MDRAGSQMLDGSDFLGRLDIIEERLERRATDPLPRGLTDPDEGSDERWEAGHVWGHMAEFVGYWQGQIESVLAEYDGEPVPFGRIKRDPGRIAAIEVGRREPVELLIERTHRSITELRRYLGTLGPAEWNAVGRHQTRGDMDIEAIVDHFIVSHLEEHLDQLDRLAGKGHSAASAG